MTDETKAIVFLLGQERKKHAKNSLTAIKIDALTLALADEAPKLTKTPEEIAAAQAEAEAKAKADAEAEATAKAAIEAQQAEDAKLEELYNS